MESALYGMDCLTTDGSDSQTHSAPTGAFLLGIIRRSNQKTLIETPMEKPHRYLGRLCTKGHDHEGTGKSLRNRDHACLACLREYSRTWKERKKEEQRELLESIPPEQRRHKTHFRIWPKIAELRQQGWSLKQIGKELHRCPGAISAHITLAKQLGHYQPKAPNPSTTFLGSLCCRGHDHNGKGQSLRYITDMHCVECRREQSKHWKRRREQSDSAA